MTLVPVNALLMVGRASVGYADDLIGNWSPFSPNAPRRTNQGLLPEESRTNNIRNNSMQGASAPNTLPTNWLEAAVSGVAHSVLTVGSLNGIDYIDVRVAGTPDETAEGILCAFESNAQIAGKPTEVWTNSLFASHYDGSLLNTQISIGLAEFSSVNELLRTTVSQIAPGASLRRHEHRVTLGPSCDTIRPQIMYDATRGVAIDFTLRIGWPQLELGSFATSPIRTTGVAATRAADVVTIAFAGGGPGSVVVSARTPSGIGTQTVWSWDDGTSENRIRVYRNFSCEVHCVVTVGGVDQVDLNLGVVVANTSFKAGFAWAENDFAASLNGATVVSATGGSVPRGLTTIRPGSDISGNYWYALQTRETVFRFRLSNLRLQVRTA